MLYLAYSSLYPDGAGAQLQRILGIYALSRFLGCGYIHVRVKNIKYQGLGVLEKGIEIPDLADCYNELVQLPSDPMTIADFGDEVINIDQPTIEDILKLREQSLMTDRNMLLTMNLPYKVVDRYPGVYSTVRGIINEAARERLAHRPFSGEFNRKEGDEIVVAVHVRRGELFSVDSDRMLSNAYYVAVCKQIADVLTRTNRRFRFELYTEVPRTNFVRNGHHYSPEDLKLSDFDQIENNLYRINQHAVSTLFNLALSDILVGSRSSFSYVAAIAGTAGRVIMPRFWHALLPCWIESDSVTGTFDREILTIN